MLALEQIREIIADRGIRLDREDLLEISALSVEVPLEDSEALAMTMEGVQLIVRDPLYRGNIDSID